MYDFENNIKKNNFCRHYCLCDSNIPWQADPRRENPHNRDELFDLYLKKLKEYELDYKIVKGEPRQRLQQVLDSSDS